MIIGDKLKEAELNCPICLTKHKFVSYLDEKSKSQTPEYKYPSCKSRLLLKNDKKNLLLGIIGLFLLLLGGYLLSGIVFSFFVFLMIVVISYLIKKKVIRFDEIEFMPE